MNAFATSSADLRAIQSVTYWRRVDGVEAMIQRCRRRAATMWLRTAADMVMAPLLVSNAGARESCFRRRAQEAVGTDHKLQRAVPDDRLDAPQAAPRQNAGELAV